MDRLHGVSGKYGLLLNKEKTKVVSTEEIPCMISVDGKVLDEVDSFCYLGTLITSDADCSKDMKSRLSSLSGRMSVQA